MSCTTGNIYGAAFRFTYNTNGENAGLDLWPTPVHVDLKDVSLNDALFVSPRLQPYKTMRVDAAVLNRQLFQTEVPTSIEGVNWNYFKMWQYLEIADTCWANDRFLSTVLHHDCEQNGSILDPVFCNDSNFVLNVNVTVPFSSSDHCSVEFDIIHNVKIAQADVSSNDFSKADWVSIASFLDYVDFLTCMLYY